MLCTASAGNSEFNDAAELNDEASLLQKGVKATRKARALGGKSLYQSQGSCCGSLETAVSANGELDTQGVTPMALILGTDAGECCRITAGMSPTVQYPLFSASKWISGIMVLLLVEQDKFTLDTKVSELLDWWTAHDDVTVRKLLQQTDGMTNYPLGLGACESDTTLDCAKEAYENCWPDGDGQSWTYSETSFYVIGAIVMNQTNTNTYDEAFQELLQPKIPSLNFNKCLWAYPTPAKADPGGGIVCSAEEFARILESLAAGTLISEDSWQAMKSSGANLPSDSYANFGVPDAPDTMFVLPPPPNSVFKYGLGHFQQTDSSGEAVVLSSLGMMGALPWMFTSNRSWGIAVRWQLASLTDESWKHAYRRLVAGEDVAWW